MSIWVKLAFSVPIIALYGILVSEAMSHRTYYHSYRWHGCVGLVLLGAAIWGLGAMARKRVEDPDGPGPSLLSTVFQPRYWGPMLMVFGVVLIFIVPKTKKTEQVVVAEKAAVKSSESAPFPSLVLQGVIYRQQDPCALINRHTLFVGETIEGARLVSVESDRAILEWKGRQQTLLIGVGEAHSSGAGKERMGL